MCALYNDIQIIWIDVHIMLLSVLPNSFSDFILHLCCDCVFGCIHMSYFCLPKAFRKLIPCLWLYIVCFPNIETPDFAFWLLQNSYEVQNLFITHAYIEILFKQNEIARS